MDFSPAAGVKQQPAPSSALVECRDDRVIEAADRIIVGRCRGAVDDQPYLTSGEVGVDV